MPIALKRGEKPSVIKSRFYGFAFTTLETPAPFNPNGIASQSPGLAANLLRPILGIDGSRKPTSKRLRPPISGVEPKRLGKMRMTALLDCAR
jgi:hypothetical protein